MSAKHTDLGDWETDGLTITTPASLFSERRMELATMSHFVPMPERIANARVMAAGPRLLSALETARACIAEDRKALFECHVDPSGGTDDLGRDGLADYDNVLSIIDAAIAKAGGEA
jgi:hypothetical protein